MTELLKCTECSWCAETPEDGEVILDNGDIISLEHIGCLECGGMLEVMPDKPECRLCYSPADVLSFSTGEYYCGECGREIWGKWLGLMGRLIRPGSDFSLD